MEVSLKIPKRIKRIVKKLKKHGYTTYLVGGCVRDLLLGIPPKDYDIGTSATPEEVLEIFKGRSQIIGRRFPIVHVYLGEAKYVEVTTFRGKEELDSEKRDNYGTPEEDAKRRDLTINALFYDIDTGEVIDFVKGLEDLKNGIIRVIGKPEVRFSQDPVRMLRAIRHSARLGFRIEPNTWQGIISCNYLIKGVKWERLRDELIKDITGYWVEKWFSLFKKTGLLFQVYPFYQDLLKDPLFSEKLLFKFLKFLGKHENLSQEQKLVLFTYLFLPLIKRPYDPGDFNKIPTFDRKELLRLFWALYFTFRFHRALFEKTMDMLRDTYKILYFMRRKRSISRKYKKKPYFDEIFYLARVIERLIKG